MTQNQAREVTPWQEGRPPFVGWWETHLWSASSTSARTPLVQRRWWNGKTWSLPVDPWASDADTLLAKHSDSNVPVFMLLWRGLIAPAPEGYTWPLDAHHRSALAAASRPRTLLTEICDANHLT